MSKAFNDMLYIFGSIAQGKSFKIDDIDDFETVLKVAKKQSCFSVVLDALKESKFDLSEETYKQMLEKSEKLFYFNFGRFIFMIEIFKRFEQNNIDYVCLKGYSVSNIYANPFSRISGDIDLLVKEDDEKKAIKILCEMGYTLASRRTEFSHHDRLIHKIWGELELHLKFFEDDVSNIWFASEEGKLSIDREPVLTQIDNYKFYTLKTNPQLIFLFFHLAKHFVSGGLSIRAMMDVALHIKNYADQIDFEEFHSILKKSGMLTFYHAVLNFMIKYCNFSETDFPYYVETQDYLIQCMYDDLESGGWIGTFKSTNQMAMKFYAEHKRDSIKYEGQMTIEKNTFKDRLRILFPTIPHLSKKYSYLKKHKYLYPFVIVLRIFTFVFKKNNKSKITDDSVAFENDMSRIQIFKSLGMLEKNFDYEMNDRK